MSVRAARAAWARPWGSRSGSGSSSPPPPDVVNVAELLREAEPGPEFGRGSARRPPARCSVLLFPGQGSQAVGMGGALLRFPRARELYAAARRVLGFDLLQLSLHGPQAALDRTELCQPAVFVASLAALEKLAHLQPAVRAHARPARGPFWGDGVQQDPPSLHLWGAHTPGSLLGHAPTVRSWMGCSRTPSLHLWGAPTPGVTAGPRTHLPDLGGWAHWVQQDPPQPASLEC